MKRIIFSLLILFMVFALVACNSNKSASDSSISATEQKNVQTSEQNSNLNKESPKPYKNNVVGVNEIKQTNNSDLPTRVIKNGTKINMHFGDTVIPGILNDSKAAKELVSRLPYTVKVSRFSFDICGVMNEPLHYGQDEVVTGWHNGDIDFTTKGDYFTILFGNEEKSAGGFVNLGVIDCELSKISKLEGNFDVLIELVKDTK